MNVDPFPHTPLRDLSLVFCLSFHLLGCESSGGEANLGKRVKRAIMYT
jgi:hypothetical protein